MSFVLRNVALPSAMAKLIICGETCGTLPILSENQLDNGHECILVNVERYHVKVRIKSQSKCPYNYMCG